MDVKEYIKSLIDKYSTYLTYDKAAKILLDKGLYTARYFIRALNPENYKDLTSEEIKTLFNLLLEEKKKTSEQLLDNPKFSEFIKFVQSQQKSEFTPWDEDFGKVMQWYENQLRNNFKKAKDLFSKIFPNIDWTGFEDQVEEIIKASLEEAKKNKETYDAIKKQWTEFTASATAATTPSTLYVGYGGGGGMGTGIPFPETPPPKEPEQYTPTPPQFDLYSLNAPRGFKWTELEGSKEPLQKSLSYVWKGFPTFSPSIFKMEG